MLWSRKPAPVHDRHRAVGIDLTASRARAEAAGEKSRALVLDAPDEELALFVAGDRRGPEVGRAGVGLYRKLPHLVCSNFLPALGQSREWKLGRHTLTAEAALGLVFDRLRAVIGGESDGTALALPAYLTPSQVTRVGAAAGRAKFALKGTAVGGLALAADRAAGVLGGDGAGPPPAAGWVVPLRPGASGPGAVMVLDADEFAVSALLVAVDREQVRAVGGAAWPRLSVKVWKERLLDAVADRCVKLCRRDPRDSGEAEQLLFEQLDEAFDRARAGQRIGLTVRTAHWFQDIVQQPEEFEAHCSALVRLAGESVRDFVNGIGLAEPPRAVWLTDAAGRLPGFVRAVHANTPEGTAVEILPPNAVAAAAAALVPRWLTGALPRAHLDSLIPLPPRPAAPAGARATPRASG
ncbi:hypothetical protein GobsT_06640 [Gemmata obscuriglobus]|uniref:Uncharacterized protein n=1 Tax=Gemmata obscuriglobus TaxID=114 RepID=A0A2Z3H1Y8_9BACT|nr:hypothetical protein [Gemmata obscuriglobus]AWM40789.1 hypothetical protein C1280_29920 [Gemmata obscuriglobus]QEG25929.1 hypothetical protein GobsT_06640 [Gemmata obscuriglobus]VTS00067.1 unnamed protein product [Gemmata obscuriglobus UQM 2246]